MTRGWPDGKAGYVYQRMAEHLAGRIESGELAANELLPGEGQLAREYGVATGTARHAIKVLRDRGYVVTIRSKGSYITDLRRALERE